MDTLLLLERHQLVRDDTLNDGHIKLTRSDVIAEGGQVSSLHSQSTIKGSLFVRRYLSPVDGFDGCYLTTVGTIWA